jgi:putative tryptophan/tyrosine transport system substrate-binding protein
MRRREFIAGLGVTVAWPQQAAMPMVGFISTRSADEPPGRPAAFRKGLSQTGYGEDQNGWQRRAL